jgi:hypothetical protein
MSHAAQAEFLFGPEIKQYIEEMYRRGIREVYPRGVEIEKRRCSLPG